MDPEATYDIAPHAECGRGRQMAARSADGPRVPDATPERKLPEVARNSGVAGALALVTLIGFLFVNGFGASHNIETILRGAAFVGFVAIGMTFIVATGNYIDLSVVAQVATAGVVTVVLGEHGLAIALLGAIGACLAFAALNWFAVGFLKANCVVVTLGVGTAGLGLLGELTKGTAYNGTSGTLHSAMTASVGPIPVVFIVVLVVAVLAQLLLTRTALGYRIKAVGANRTAAMLAGVRTEAVVAVAFAAVALTCALAGAALAGYNNGAIVSMGEGYDFSALAAVIIGGNSLLGGEGSAARTLAGVLFVEVLLNVLVVAGLAFTWQRVVLGGIVILAVATDALLRRDGAST